MRFPGFTRPHATSIFWTVCCCGFSRPSLHASYRSANTCHLHVLTVLFIGTHNPALALQLPHEIYQYRAHLFAESTKATYKTNRDTYFRFCAYMGYAPVPVEPEHLCQYVAFLARSLKVSSIQQYINIVGLLHKQLGLPNPLLNNWPLKSLITGIKQGGLKGSPMMLYAEVYMELVATRGVAHSKHGFHAKRTNDCLSFRLKSVMGSPLY